MSKKCMSIMKKGAGGYSGELVSYQPGRNIVVTRGRRRLVRGRMVRLRRDIAEHRVRLEPIRAEAVRDARACGLTGGPAALYVAREVRKHPLSAPTYTAGDRRKRAKMLHTVVEAPRPLSRRQKRRAAVEEAQRLREWRHESRLHARGML